MKDRGVAGSSVVLKSEFTTHTKENTFGEESYTKTITTQNERTYDTIDSTKLPSIFAIVLSRGYSYTNVCYFLNDSSL